MHEEGGTVKPENIFGKERRSGKEVTQLIFPNVLLVGSCEAASHT